MSAEAVAVLVRAREMVVDGWCQGTGHIRDAEGVTVKRCAGQAIQDAFYEVNSGPPIRSTCMCGCTPTGTGGALFNRVMEEFQRTIDCGNIPSWNDTSVRTKDEVLRAFDVTIERMRTRLAAKAAMVPEKIEATWEPITIPAPEPKIVPVLVESDEPVGIVKKVLASLGV
jgi:hypothetical protein